MIDEEKNDPLSQALKEVIMAGAEFYMQLRKVIEKKSGLTNGEYVAAFSDGTVSEILTEGTVPHHSEGEYVRIFKNDSKSEIEAKLGSL